MIELTTGLLMLASAFSPVSAPKNMVKVEKMSAEAEAATISATSVNIEIYVREYFKDTPILAEIARCESTFRQLGKNGEPIKGIVNKGDIGVMQINKYYHEEDALELGHDIYTLEGNLEFAKILYKKYGTDPWSSSSKCWKKSSQVAMR
jgi:hypothetical protein